MPIKNVKGQFPEDYLRLKKGVVDERGHGFSAFSVKWKKWDNEGIDVAERERRIANSQYGYTKQVGGEMKSKGLFCADESNRLSHLYIKLATIAFSNGNTVTERRSNPPVTTISPTFRDFWTQCMKKQLSESEILIAFEEKGFNKERVRRIIVSMSPAIEALVIKYQKMMKTHSYKRSAIQYARATAKEMEKEGKSVKQIEAEFIRRGYNGPPRSTRSSYSNEQQEAIQWAVSIALKNGWGDVEQTKLPSKELQVIKAQMSRVKDVERFQTKFPKTRLAHPNWSSPVILEKYLNDTEEQWTPVVLETFQSGEQIFTNSAARNRFIDRLTEAVGYGEVAIGVFNYLRKQEIGLESEEEVTDQLAA